LSTTNLSRRRPPKTTILLEAVASFPTVIRMTLLERRHRHLEVGLVVSVEVLLAADTPEVAASHEVQAETAAELPSLPEKARDRPKEATRAAAAAAAAADHGIIDVLPTTRTTFQGLPPPRPRPDLPV
jgi:hypothetical protein